MEDGVEEEEAEEENVEVVLFAMGEDLEKVTAAVVAAAAAGDCLMDGGRPHFGVPRRRLGRPAAGARRGWEEAAGCPQDWPHPAAAAAAAAAAGTAIAAGAPGTIEGIVERNSYPAPGWL